MKYNSTAPFCITYPNGSKIYLLGSENPDALRGMALWGAAFDEYSQQPSNVFSEVVSKALADHKGYAIFFGTPKGKNEFWRLYEGGRNGPRLDRDDRRLPPGRNRGNDRQPSPSA